MSCERSLIVSMVGLLLVAPAVALAGDVGIGPWVAVGNPGNPADSLDCGNSATGVINCGSVAETFYISATEVTNDQYAGFLNAKAASDPNALFSTAMQITRSGSDGSYTYAVNAGKGSHPVVHVSFFDAMRFVNWLENGQASGDTESGVYTIGNGVNETRAPGATFFIPNRDEWYKAAYHDSGSTYSLYPTGSDTAPTAEGPPGGANSANYNDAVGDHVDVGSYTNTTSFYGAFDMGGNVFELLEEVYTGTGTLRYIMGGGSAGNEGTLASTYLNAILPDKQTADTGFRVATIPEPATLALLGLGGLAVLAPRRRRPERG